MRENLQRVDHCARIDERSFDVVLVEDVLDGGALLLEDRVVVLDIPEPVKQEVEH